MPAKFWSKHLWNLGPENSSLAFELSAGDLRLPMMQVLVMGTVHVIEDTPMVT